jgi:response regulator RpfG family c-di-GMP phosphodiesterase
LPHQIAIDEIVRCAGTQFDPELAEAFVKMCDEWRAQMRRRGEEALLPP